MPDKVLNATRFAERFRVSRETIELLEAYVSLIKKWNTSINLVSRSTIDGIWHRHIADSAQLLALSDAKVSETWLDIGSGGGLPGIVIAILAKESKAPGQVILIESDARKCAFLRTVARDLELAVTIIENRTEHIPKLNADIISARAFAGLSNLLSVSASLGSDSARLFFLKGRGHEAELTEAQENWNIDVESIPSMTDSSARILKIKGISRADSPRT